MRMFHHSKLFARFLLALSWASITLLVSFPVSAEGKAQGYRNHPHSASLDGWSVRAKRPEVVGENMIVGKFVFKKESVHASATRGGGACLVADLNDNYPCETRDDCLQAQLDGDVKPTPAGGFIYCDSVNGRENKRCWTRPTGNGCSRSPTRTPGVYETAAASSIVDGEPEGVVWITLACLSADTDTDLGCGSLDPTQHIYDSSPRLDLREDADDDCD